MHGLKNLGNTCYINSVLQCLSVIEGFKIECLKNKKFSSEPMDILTAQFKLILRELVKHEYPLSPSSFVLHIKQKFKQFDSSNQQDVSEFLLALLNYLHENMVIEKQIKFAKDFKNTSKHTLKALENWRKNIKHLSPVSKTFYGQSVDFFKCTGCEYKFRNFAPFLTLDLALVKSDKTSLTHLIHRYFKTDIVYMECVNCGSKNTDTEHELTRGIVKLPECLIICLKRYNSKQEKNNIQVSLDETMDFSDYTYSFDGYESVNYRLKSIICHNGRQTDSGHYFTLVKNHDDNTWLCFSDLKVFPVEYEKLNQSLPYILFYEKLKNN